jgi:hypothetical protein
MLMQFIPMTNELEQAGHLPCDFFEGQGKSAGGLKSALLRRNSRTKQNRFFSATKSHRE